MTTWHLTVYIIVHNYAEIAAVVSIIWKLHYFAHLAWKRQFMSPKIVGGVGGFQPQIGEQYQPNPQKAHPCVSLRRLSNQAWKSVDGSDL